MSLELGLVLLFVLMLPGPAHAQGYGGAGDGDLGVSGQPTSVKETPTADVFNPRLSGLQPTPRRPPLFIFFGSGVPDPVEELLGRAEAAFHRGEEYYVAGHLEHARGEFDRALDLFLTSPVAVPEDPRLLLGFDRLADRIHRLEQAALRDAAAAEPPEVPAPIEEIAPLTFPPDPQLRARVEQELATLAHDLPLALNERVLSVLNFFQTERGRRILQNGLRRAGRYRDFITAILDEEGLPRDLIYLAQAESAFQPHARSRARAVGLWQFVKWRGEQYGLKVNWWVDERRDPVKSTRAAARHLRDLYQEFGDWYLVMAAYNSGPGRVARALERAGRANYWELVEAGLLPRETRNYVPIILAVALVAKNPDHYGVEVEPDPPLRFETVKVSKPTDLRRLAEVIGVDVGTLRELNPHLLRNVTPPDQADFVLYVPPGTAETLLAELPRLPEASRALWQQHRVRRGETLSRLAVRYRTSAQAIADANGISLRSRIHPGDVLVIPSGGGRREFARRRQAGTSSSVSARARTRTPVRAASPTERRHRVRSGETLWELSRRYGTSVPKLRKANPFLADRDLRAGDRLLIPE